MKLFCLHSLTEWSCWDVLVRFIENFLISSEALINSQTISYFFFLFFYFLFFYFYFILFYLFYFLFVFLFVLFFIFLFFYFFFCLHLQCCKAVGGGFLLYHQCHFFQTFSLNFWQFLFLLHPKPTKRNKCLLKKFFKKKKKKIKKIK